MLAASATADGWRVRFRLVSRDHYDAFRETLLDRDYGFDLLEFTRPEDPRHLITDLTPAQREPLTAAREHGYYEVPREMSARELATELGVSHQNLSELLRREMAKVIDDALRTTADTDTE